MWQGKVPSTNVLIKPASGIWTPIYGHPGHTAVFHYTFSSDPKIRLSHESGLLATSILHCLEWITKFSGFYNVLSNIYVWQEKIKQTFWQKEKKKDGCEKKEDVQQHFTSGHLWCAWDNESEVGNGASVWLGTYLTSYSVPLKIKARGYVQCGSTAQVLNKIFLGVDRLPALKQILLF